MSMNSKNLSVLAYANGFTLWHYRTEDTKATVLGAGYFDAVQNIFNVGDLIITSTDVEGERTTTMLVVKNLVNGNVQVANLS